MRDASVIVWDWNGTLLNDLELSLSCINNLLEKRNLPRLDRQKYKEVFSFPIKDYYESIGFDFSQEDFDVPAMEYIRLYDSGVENCLLQPRAVETLEYFKTKGMRQFVLSAMHQDMLERTLKHNGIYQFFEGVAGLGDHYAVSKVERGKQLLGKFNIERENAWIVGDTIHDFEVAQELEIRCILVADGHQSKNRLKETGSPVLNNISDLLGVGEISEN
ncbi:phosphoglycolate phosphatase [Mariniphaga anaerophila]|uniref:phosphoglycolate phosphatase n=1 Tax=Mariniphaga anaerophila TaxID=1484053 RepID=A0A1M4YDJ6_9BACT|nr:HAD family hydrolase [Mariniphaga anaerophila]SHF03663.1 phosphoglycolate phosphatase [Mariniphaga anaerophila]